MFPTVLSCESPPGCPQLPVVRLPALPPTTHVSTDYQPSSLSVQKLDLSPWRGMVVGTFFFESVPSGDFPVVFSVLSRLFVRGDDRAPPRR